MPIVKWRVAHVIHALRIEYGWQVKELARHARLNSSVIYRIEDGRVIEPKEKTLEKIAAAFGVTVMELRSAVPRQAMAFTANIPAAKLTAEGEPARKKGAAR